MECYTCGKEEDILYTCQECKAEAGYCPDHRYDHEHVAPEPEPEEPEYDFNPQRGQTITNENVWRNVPYAWTSGKEWKDLLIGSFILTLIFGLNFTFDFPEFQIPGERDIKFIVIIGILVSISFIVHELSHKYAAIRYGHDARFILNVANIAISLVFILLDWSFIWIGAAYVFAQKGMGEEHGIIAGIGPFSNLVMGTVGIGLFYFFDTAGMLSTLVWDIQIQFWLQLFVYLNGFIGLFNMIPFAMLDGAKIWAWNKQAWISLTLGLFAMWLISQSLTGLALA